MADPRTRYLNDGILNAENCIKLIAEKDILFIYGGDPEHSSFLEEFFYPILCAKIIDGHKPIEAFDENFLHPDNLSAEGLPITTLLSRESGYAYYNNLGNLASLFFYHCYGLIRKWMEKNEIKRDMTGMKKFEKYVSDNPDEFAGLLDAISWMTPWKIVIPLHIPESLLEKNDPETKKLLSIVAKLAKKVTHVKFVISMATEGIMNFLFNEGRSGYLDFDCIALYKMQHNIQGEETN